MTALEDVGEEQNEKAVMQGSDAGSIPTVALVEDDENTRELSGAFDWEHMSEADAEMIQAAAKTELPRPGGGDRVQDHPGLQPDRVVAVGRAVPRDRS